MIKFSYEIRDRGSRGLELVLKGYLDEDTDLPPPETFKNSHHLTVNFRMVKAILSIGIKKWINFADQIEQIPHLNIDFTDCSKQVVDQINLVEGFLPENAKVKSIFVPIFCEKCNRAFKVLRETENITSEIHDVIKTMDGIDCESFPDCKRDYALEVNPRNYLRFLKK